MINLQSADRSGMAVDVFTGGGSIGAHLSVMQYMRGFRCGFGWGMNRCGTEAESAVGLCLSEGTTRINAESARRGIDQEWAPKRCDTDSGLVAG